MYNKKKQSEEENKVLLTNIPSQISKEDIRKFFKDCGDIK